jgi:hypothetical protein
MPEQIPVQLTIYDDGKPPVIFLDIEQYDEIISKMHMIVRWSSNFLGCEAGVESCAAFMVPIREDCDSELVIRSTSIEEHLRKGREMLEREEREEREEKGA